MPSRILWGRGYEPVAECVLFQISIIKNEQENINKVIERGFKAKRIVSTITDLLPGI